MFDLKEPATFHAALDDALSKPERTKQFGRAGQELVRTKFDSTVLARQVKKIYEQLIEEKR